MIITDCQVHTWLADSPQRPWLPARAAAVHQPEPITTERLLDRMNEAGVDRAVIVPPSWDCDRVDYALDGARRHPRRLAVMGRFPVEEPAQLDRLQEWIRQPGMLGVRLSLVSPTELEWLRDGTIDWFWAAAERAGIPVAIRAPASMRELDAIADRHPGLRLLIDHLNLSREVVAADTIDETIAAVIGLARHPNVYAKISAIPTASRDAYPFRDMHDRIRQVLEAFGPRRCLWGSDLSRLLLKGSYRECVALFTEALDFLSAADKDWIMGRALAECLNWPPAPTFEGAIRD